MIDTSKLTKKIYQKLDGALTIATISEVVSIIIEYLKNELLHNRDVSIDKFGTFSTKRKKSILISNRTFFDSVIISKSRKHLKFYPHQIFKILLKPPAPKVEKILGRFRKS